LPTRVWPERVGRLAPASVIEVFVRFSSLALAIINRRARCAEDDMMPALFAPAATVVAPINHPLECYA